MLFLATVLTYGVCIIFHIIILERDLIFSHFMMLCSLALAAMFTFSFVHFSLFLILFPEEVVCVLTCMLHVFSVWISMWKFTEYLKLQVLFLLSVWLSHPGSNSFSGPFLAYLSVSLISFCPFVLDFSNFSMLLFGFLNAVCGFLPLLYWCWWWLL